MENDRNIDNFKIFLENQESEIKKFEDLYIELFPVNCKVKDLSDLENRKIKLLIQMLKSLRSNSNKLNEELENMKKHVELSEKLYEEHSILQFRTGLLIEQSESIIDEFNANIMDLINKEFDNLKSRIFSKMEKIISTDLTAITTISELERIQHEIIDLETTIEHELSNSDEFIDNYCLKIRKELTEPSIYVKKIHARQKNTFKIIESYVNAIHIFKKRLMKHSNFVKHLTRLIPLLREVRSGSVIPIETIQQNMQIERGLLLEILRRLEDLYPNMGKYITLEDVYVKNDDISDSIDILISQFALFEQKKLGKLE
ncbi:MAG: hypothetical protein INQ03_08945 [Candidatus Heimdallarchaeota archaeon]|nr:hypothetical protein [Candidatus Heimdallarchaeota archaeon]